MNKKLIAILTSLVLVSGFSNFKPVNGQSNDQDIKNTFGCFIENRGQWDSDILYMGNTSFGKVAFTKENVWYESSNTVSKLTFLNCSSQEVIPSEVQKQVTNYIQGTRTEWCLNCKNYSQITYKNLWGNNDCTYYFSESGLHYEYSSKSNIDVEITGKSLNEIKEQFIAYKNKSNISQTETNEKSKDSEIEPKVNPKDLKVEDAVLYCTFIGGYSLDDCSGIVVDNQENVYIAGSTKSKLKDNFPIKEPCFSKDNMGDYDIFVTKLNPSGDEIIYSTFIGGTDYDFCNDVCIDEQNNIYLVGDTFSNNSEKFPVGNNIPGFDKTYGTNNDAITGYILKLNSTGTDLIYSSYIGGDSNDYCNSITLDDSNRAYIAGVANSSEKSFPIGGGIPGFDQNFKSHGGYIIKVDPSGTNLDFSTFISGTNFDEINDIAIDKNGCSYIIGCAESTDDESFPIGGDIPGFDQIHNGLKDAFVIKIDSSGTRLIYSTYIGGDKNDEGICIIVDENDCAYVTGTTFSKENTFPVSDSIPGFYKHHKEHEDIFCIKLNPEGTDLLYASYLGGSDEDSCHSICLGPDNELYVSGDTRSDDGGFPTGGRYPGLFPIFRGNIDSFLVEINTVGDDILFSTFFGGRMEEENTFCALSNNNIFIAGKTTSTENDNPSFPIMPNIPGYSKRNRGGSGDIFVAKITFNEPKKEEPKPFLDTYISSDKITLKQNRQDTQTLTIKNLGEKDSVLEGTLNIETGSSSTNVDWLTINRSNFKLLESEVLDAEVTISSSELDPGKYSGTILITSNDPKNPEVYVHIMLEVLKLIPSIEYSIEDKSFKLKPDILKNTGLIINNKGEDNSELQVTVSSSRSWLSFEDKTFSLSSNEEKTILVNINSRSLDPGEYNGFIIINSNDPDNSRISIDVNLEVVPEEPILWLDKSIFNKEMVKGTTKYYSFAIKNEGKKSSLLTANVSSSESWININADNIELNPNEKRHISFSLNAINLIQNKIYKGSIILTSNDPDQSKIQIPISLKVLPVELVITLQIGNIVAKKEYTDKRPSNTITLDSAPTVINGRTVVPLRFLAEAFGATLAWDGKAKEIQIKYKDMLIHLWLHRKYGRKFDALIERTGKTPEKISLSTPPCIINGRTMVPLRFISETFGASLEWDGKTQTIILRIEI